MSLPNLPAGDRYRREVRTEWGGLNLNESAGEGELIEAMNLSSREYPLLSSTAFRLRITAADPHLTSPLRWNGTMCYIKRRGEDDYGMVVENDETVFGSPLRITDATADAVRCAATRDGIYIFPAKQMYRNGSGALEDMEASWSGSAVFDNGTYAGETAAANAIRAEGIGTVFRAGDAVTIAGCAVRPNNNKTAIIREISGGELRFYENTFELGNVRHVHTSDGILAAGDYWFIHIGTAYHFNLSSAVDPGTRIEWTSPDQVAVWPVHGAGYAMNTEPGISGTQLEFSQIPAAHTETGITIRRAVPDMDYVCVNGNRLWGCKGDTVYASKLGDPLNWNVFDDLSTDSWTAETGTPGDFTGCTSFQGYPTFFKGGCVFRVLGDEPRNFTLRKTGIMGVDKGSDRSLAEIRGRLYYVSPMGVAEWNGGDRPAEISHALGTESGELLDAIGGTDGVRYYVELTKRPYDPSREPETHLYIYDTRYGIWHETDCSAAGRTWFWGDGVDFGMFRTREENGTVRWDSIDLAGPGRSIQGMTAPPQRWAVTFAPSTRAYKTALTGSEAKKGVLRLLIRCKLAGSMKVWLAYDGGTFTEAAEIGGENGAGDGSHAVPLILRRCDSWQLRLTGTGDAVIRSIAVERYGGEWQQA